MAVDKSHRAGIGSAARRVESASKGQVKAAQVTHAPANPIHDPRQLGKITKVAGGAAKAIQKSASRFGQVTVRTAEQALDILRNLYAQSPSAAAEELQRMARSGLKPSKQGAA